MRVRTILVPVDFSTHAEQALDYAIALAQALQARLSLLHVRDDTDLYLWSYTAQAEAEARQAMAGYLARVQAAGVAGQSTMAHGVPWREIVETARATGVDLIIMGTHGRTGLQHALIGSVAERVVQHAPCPVLVTRH
jgi:nucleotide-binding universal stress UspA family protein